MSNHTLPCADPEMEQAIRDVIEDPEGFFARRRADRAGAVEEITGRRIAEVVARRDRTLLVRRGKAVVGEVAR